MMLKSVAVSLIVSVSWCFAPMANAATLNDTLVFPPGYSSDNMPTFSADVSAMFGNTMNNFSNLKIMYWSPSTDVVDLTNLSNPDGNNTVYGISGNGRFIVGGKQNTAMNTVEAYRWSATTGLVTLGGLDSNNVLSLSQATNTDGSVVVGLSLNAQGGVEAFRWTQAGGMIGLGSLDTTNVNSNATHVSHDGNVVAGVSMNSFGTSEAFRWTPSGGMVGLGGLNNGYIASNVTWMKNDGNIIVGTSANVYGELEAYRWSEATGMVGLGGLDHIGLIGSKPTLVRDDGNVIVGSSYNVSGVEEAFRWTEATGIIGLGGLNSRNESSATAMNTDGSVIVGGSQLDAVNEYEAFRWTQDSGMVSLGTLGSPGDSVLVSAALAVDGTGNKVVGYSYAANVMNAFYWTEASGMRALSDVLAEAGVDMTDWFLNNAYAISKDGKLIYGTGTHGADNVVYMANMATGGVTTPEDLSNSMQTIQQSGQQVAAVARNYAPNGLFIAQNMPQLSVPASAGGGVYGGQMSGSADAFGNLSPASGGRAPSRLGAFLLGSVGIGHNNTSGNYQLNGTLGISMQLSDSWNIGAGMIAGRTRTDMNFNGDSRLDALGGMAMASYVPYESPLRIYGTAFVADLTVDNKRGYLNGSGLDYSRGDTGGFSYGGALRLGWEKELFSNQTTMMPYIEGRYSKTKIDGYSERGGAFAASFSDQEDDYTASRLGLEFKHQLNEKTQLLFRPAWGHRFGGNGDGFTATTSGLTMGYAGQAGDRDWAEASVGGSYQATEKLTFTIELTTRTGDTSEPLASVTIGAFMKF